jgi:hypothetical protein
MTTRRPTDRPFRPIRGGLAKAQHPDPELSPDASPDPSQSPPAPRGGRGDRLVGKAKGCRALPQRGTPHPGGVHLLGGGTLVIPGRTLDDPDDARALAAAILAAAAHIEASR